MKANFKRLTTVLLLTTALTFIFVWASFADETGALLVLPEKKFDFGYVVQNVSISHPFVLRNGGTDSLFILKVKPG